MKKNVSLPRVTLAYLPTPIEKLNTLSSILNGPPIYIKRDDQTGLALGGNKTRKLEFLIADALRQGADTVITAGAAQSNHCRQTAAAAASFGLKCDLVLGGDGTDESNGNLLLDKLLGATIHWTGSSRRGEQINEIFQELKAKGQHPYIIPYGGSNGIGAQGYVHAIKELIDQLKESKIQISHIVFASSSGGTQAGLVVGAKVAGFAGKIIGISVDKEEYEEISYEAELAQLSHATAQVLGVEMEFELKQFFVNYDYLGDGYGIVGSLEQEAISLMARHEGILLDPVYTGRAMGGLIDMIRNNVFSSQDSILFWHTGGTPALFAYSKELT